ncbi:hypothetical protein ACWET9_44855 [Streptomyces sp. NPDC004059]
MNPAKLLEHPDKAGRRVKLTRQRAVARVIVSADEEGTGPDDAVFTVEIQPHLGAE